MIVMQSNSYKYNDKLISVIMPAYNAEKYIGEAINSILSQTYTNFEFIIINDGSTDKTEEIIQSYDDNRIRYVKNASNLKLIKSLNKGIDLARGEYIARMDADDISLPNRFQEEYDFMEQNPDISVCSSNVYYLFPNKIKKSRYYPSRTPAGCNFCSIFRTPLSHPASFFRSEFLKEFKYDESNFALHIEAFVLWGNYALANKKMAVVSKRLLLYRINEQSVCHLYSETQIDNHKRRVRYMLKSMINLDVSDAVLDAMYDLKGKPSINNVMMAVALINRAKEKYIQENTLNLLQEKDIRKTSQKLQQSILKGVYHRVGLKHKVQIMLFFICLFLKK